MRGSNTGFMQKYSIGIILTFGLLVLDMVYIFPISSLITGEKGLSVENYFITRFSIWIILFIIMLYAKMVEKGNFLLWKDIKYSVGKSLLFGFLLYCISAFGGGIISVIIKFTIHEVQSEKLVYMMRMFRGQYFLIFFTCLTAAVTEEYLFRGYIQSRLKAIYSSSGIAIVLSAILFAILHSSYGTITNFAVPLFIGLVFAIFYDKYRNLRILMVVHFLIDFITLMGTNLPHIKH